MWRALPIWILAVVAAAAAGSAQAVPVLYWTDEGGDFIQRMNADDGVVENIASGVNSSGIDSGGGRLYWVDRGLSAAIGDETIRSSDLDGADVQVLVTTFDGLRVPVDVEVDVQNGFLYWTDIFNLTIRRAAFDPVLGTLGAVDVLVDLVANRAPNYGAGLGQTLEFTEAFALALDESAGVLYWTDRFGGYIHRGGVDGSWIEQIASSGTGTELNGIDVDPAAGKVYWTTGRGNEIQRADLDGANVETLVVSAFAPHDIAVDPGSSRIIWTNPEVGLVQSANLDGSGLLDEAALAPGAGPTGLTISVPEPSGPLALAAALGALGVLGGLRRRA